MVKSILLDCQSTVNMGVGGQEVAEEKGRRFGNDMSKRIWPTKFIYKNKSVLANFMPLFINKI
jgi:hypothetical protein